MSYAFDGFLPYSLAVLTGSISSASLTLKWAFVLDGSSLQGAGQPTAATFNAITNLAECNYTGYSRKTITGGAVTINTSATPHRAEWTFTESQYAGLAAGSPSIVGALLFIDGADDAHRIPLLYFDDRQYFPFSGGSDLFLAAASGGSVRAST